MLSYIYIAKICHFQIFWNLFTNFWSKTLITIVLNMFLGIFYLLDWFQIYSQVPMIYYEFWYVSKSKKIKVNLNYHFKHEILNKDYKQHWVEYPYLKPHIFGHACKNACHTNLIKSHIYKMKSCGAKQWPNHIFYHYIKITYIKLLLHLLVNIVSFYNVVR
jgi:hypothetical protein